MINEKILLTFIGNNDVYAMDNSSKGAILSILEKSEFEKIYLFYNNSSYLKTASKILLYCRKFHKNTEVKYQEIKAINPTDYNIIYPAMFQAVKSIQEDNLPNTEYTISVTSGTPTMHSCWIFLQQGGVINAKLIQVSRELGIQEINFDLDDFPKINQPEKIKVEMTKLSRENESLKNSSLDFNKIIGKSTEIEKVKKQIANFSKYDISVFIYGETGTGKELVAEAIHYNSNRKEKPFIAVNCGAIPSSLFESELFGHKKGSFTGANSDRNGKFKLADGGTLFLDEIGDLPLDMQVKLLRTLQEDVIQPVGGFEEKVDVRIISATNKDIRLLIEKGEFREDLYYRIVKAQIDLPSLNDRNDDVIILAKSFLQQFNKKYNSSKKFHSSVYSELKNHFWKGNIRELQSCIETAFVISENEITTEHLFTNRLITSENSEITIPENGIDFDNEIIPKYYRKALKMTNGNAAKAARLLKIKEHTFRERIKKLKLKGDKIK